MYTFVGKFDVVEIHPLSDPSSSAEGKVDILSPDGMAMSVVFTKMPSFSHSTKVLLPGQRVAMLFRRLDGYWKDICTGEVYEITVVRKALGISRSSG